jgi:hypothetical protein
VAAATGISLGTAHNASRLLLPDAITGRRITDLDQAERLADDRVDGVVCFRVHGRLSGDTITLWVSKSDFLLRRIETRERVDALPGQTVATSILIRPVANGVIELERLKFDPPGYDDGSSMVGSMSD